MSVTDTTNIEPLWDKAISSISQLDVLYENGTVTQKRKIIGSMFPEKLTFDGFQYRTTRINEALNLMLLINSKIQGKKNGTNLLNSDLSHQVTQLGTYMNVYDRRTRTFLKRLYKEEITPDFIE